MVADQVAHPAHLNARDTTLVFVSRAPQERIAELKERMGWERIPWYTLTDDFDADFGVGEWHGTNAFIRDGEGRIFRTYFVDKRGDEVHGRDLGLPRHHSARAPGDLGGLTGGISADRSLRVVEPSRRVREREREHLMIGAHVGGLPLEELLAPALTGGAAAGFLVTRSWISAHLRRRRRGES